MKFTFDGRAVEAYEGETIGAALCAAGITTLSRSFKYHRRRGLLCVSGRCPNCLMTVDGVPNVRACVEPVRQGAVARSQHAWPSLERDVQAVFDRFDHLLPVGFYYKTFMRPKWLWPHYETVLRHLAGLGRIDIGIESHEHTEVVHLHTPLAVVGGGPAGMSAALQAARLGVEVILIDDQPKLGGHLRWHLLPSEGGTPDHEQAERLAAEVREEPRIRHLENPQAFGFYEGNLLGVAHRDRLIRIRAERVIAATGGFEHPLIFQNNDLPGTFLATGILRLIRLYGVRPGKRAVVAANDDRGLRVARELLAAGIEVAAVADARPAADSEHAAALGEAGVMPLFGCTVLEARGRGRVDAVRLVRLDDSARPIAGSEREIAVDLLVLATGWEPNAGLLAQNGCALRYREDLGAFLPSELPEGVFAGGEVAGIRGLGSILRHGEHAGLRAAVSLGAGSAADRTAAGVEPESEPQGLVRPLVAVSQEKSKQFVCLCEDVSTKDIRTAVGEGFDHIQTLKRYSTVTMGPCQGKMCHHAAVSLCADATGKGFATTGTTTARPPSTPVPLGILAGPAHDPIRRTPFHHQHEDAKATWMDMGAWKRPLLYSSVEEECRAVHERVGIIDVSPLGKLDIQGGDAAAFLEWIHPNRIANLKQGRIRYRLMLDDSGIIMDDGTIARLGDDHFFVTTGTGALEGVEQWLEWWLATGQRCTHVTNVTAAFGAINVAGPRSRELLVRLTELDLSNQAVPYLATASGTVAGVPALLLRIGFVGELGYEIHFPAEYGEYLWSTLLEAGRDLGIQPFGVEAQRVLRLEKLHIIPNHDTDALSNPFEANMSWAVKLDKPDFIGRAALARQAASPVRQRLVGFELNGATVPKEGEAVVVDGAPVGRVSSAKWSPLLQRAIGMAWVPVDLAAAGKQLHIQSGKQTLGARVVIEPFYDPAGERLKS
ncbi:MAG: 2Fe-2S iron-sulfur cluster-binding protein [Bryobacterales bacterium]